MGIKKWFSRKSKVVLKNPATTTRLYDIYGETQDLDLLKAKVTEIENLVNNLPPLPDLTGYYTKAEIDAKPYAKTNIENTFTTSQTINGNIKADGFYKDGANQKVAYVNAQGEKNIDLLYQQQSAGFRNYCNLNIKHKYGNTNEVTLFQVKTKNTGEGIFFNCEGNKLSFESDTEINNVTTPTTNKQAANKEYVDNSIANIDLTQYAKKAEDNNFVNQSIKDNTPYLSFRHFQDGSRYGYIGNETINNQNVVINAEKADLELKATGRVICSKTPTQGTDIVNKAYVDSMGNNLFIHKSSKVVPYSTVKSDIGNSNNSPSWLYILPPTQWQVNNLPTGHYHVNLYIYRMSGPSGDKDMTHTVDLFLNLSGNVLINFKELMIILNTDLMRGTSNAVVNYSVILTLVRVGNQITAKEIN